MLPLIKYYLKQNSILILVILIVAILSRFVMPGIENLNSFLIWALAYRMAAEEHSRKCWNYFQSLPLSYQEKAVVKIAFPILLLAILWKVSGLKLFVTDASPTQLMFLTPILIATVLVLSSLVAKSLIQNILYVLLFGALTQVANFQSGYIFIIGIYIGLSLYVLSGKRWHLWRTLALAFVISAPVALIDQFANERILISRLSSSNIQLRWDATQTLLRRGSNHTQARQSLATMLNEDMQVRMVRQVFRSLRRYKQGTQISEERFWELIDQDRRTRELVFRYLMENRKSQSWIYNLDFVLRAESYAVQGRPPCEDDCKQLAELMSVTIFETTGGEEHLKSHLQAENLLKLEYALMILEQQARLHFKEHLTELSQNIDHPRLKMRIRMLLKQVHFNEFGSELGEMIGRRIEQRLKERLPPSPPNPPSPSRVKPPDLPDPPRRIRQMIQDKIEELDDEEDED